LLDATANHVFGIGAERAKRELLAGKQPKKVVLVAVIDGGIDTAHASLKPNLWSNPKETPGNAVDDDNDGYVDDVRGWDFIGGRDGKDVHYDTFELTRLHARCTGAAPGSQPPSTPAEKEMCNKIAEDFNKKVAETKEQMQQIDQISAVYDQIIPILRSAVGSDSLTVSNVAAVRPSRTDVARAREIYLQLAGHGITPKDVKEAKEGTASQLQYGLNLTYDPRSIVGDNYGNTAERRYGNPDVMGPDAKHGTHVAGIIGGVRSGTAGTEGVASSVRLMMIRAVPDGDERDKDIANAIRYATDQGASIISMSFGKSYSPQKTAVDDAVKYADSKGVLMVHAAGNDSEDNDKKPSFPTPYYAGGGKAQNWIEVGASSWRGGDSLVAPFSNYGHQKVDVFAPGVDILSTVPGGGYDRESGTSMAAPVVAGIAALLMSYYPELSAGDVKRIILSTVTPLPNQPVLRPTPGGEPSPKVLFGTLSATGGIVNAYNAVQMAEQGNRARP
jgi:subtilisin family serine protease